MSTPPSSSTIPLPEIAGIGRRFVALVIDWFVALMTVSLISATPAFGTGATDGWWTLLAFWLQVSILDGTLGFSIGKRVLGLCVVGANGRPIGLRAFVRTALVCLVVPPLVQNKEGRGIHDVFAGSVITYLRPRTKAG